MTLLFRQELTTFVFIVMTTIVYKQEHLNTEYPKITVQQAIKKDLSRNQNN